MDFERLDFELQKADVVWGDMDHSPSDGVGQVPHQMVKDVVWCRSSIKISHHGLNHPWVSVREALPLCLLAQATDDVLPQKR